MHRSLVGAFALTAAATLVSAQEPSSGGGGRQVPPVFEAGTELVRLDLVVRDEGGDLVRDLRTFYEIAYVPPNPEADGKFRRIEVKVARDDAKIRVRKGYYALPPGVLVIHPWEVSLAQALENDVLPRQLPVRAGTVRLAPDLRASRAVVLVEVPLGDLEPRVAPETGHWSTHVSMVAFVKDDEDRVVARLSQDWPLEGQGSPSGLRGRNVMLKRTVDLAPGS